MSGPASPIPLASGGLAVRLFVVMSSGNYRGAQWATVGTNWSWAEDGE